MKLSGSLDDLESTGDFSLKFVYLAVQKASQKCTMALHDWRAAMNRFAIEFEGRFS